MNLHPDKDQAFYYSRTILGHIKDGTIREILDDWKWIFSYSRHYKGAIVFYTLLGIFSTTMGLVGSVAGKYLIDIITGYQTDKLWLLIILTVGSGALSLATSSVLNRLLAKLRIDINHDIQADIFDQIIDADWLAISGYANGDVLHRFRSDTETVATNAISWLPSIIISIYNFIATFFVIWHFNIVMAVFAFASAPVLLASSKFLITKQREYNKKMKEMNAKVVTFEVETFYNMDTIKSFGISSLYGRKLRDWQQKYRKTVLDHNLFTIKTNVFLSVMGMIIKYAAFGYCLFLLWTRQITYGTMTLFLQQRSNLEGAFRNMVGIIPSFLTSSVSAHRIRELAQLKKEQHFGVAGEQNEAFEGYRVSKAERLSPDVLPDKDGNLHSTTDGVRVEMHNVDFAYKEGKPVIASSDFTAHPGEIVAIVGPSGEGKTTMIRLILGLVHPSAGQVSLIPSDGTVITSNADTRHIFAYVPQGNTILSGTIAENMRMVKEDATDEEIIEALKTACAWSFVQNLPSGIDSPVGERGRGLSEGQAQRIAIARAVLRNAPVLLLDEATSALDITTERTVLRNLTFQNPARTCIVTTHRPTVLGISSRVYRVMDTHLTELSEEESAKMAMDF